jgi:hypothetical protein
MQKIFMGKTVAAAAVLLVLQLTYASEVSRTEVIQGNKNSKKHAMALWEDPEDIKSRNLYYGPGGRDHIPKGPFSFVEEDLEGTNPKFDVRDRAGNMWKVKLGVEARPEVAASRLLWAAGYFVPENYYVTALRIERMPGRLKRGRELVSPDGFIYGARMKRTPGLTKIGTWTWKKNPFAGTREFNGLRVMMAILNNPDLKDSNNAIFREARSQYPTDVYMVSDLGSSFSGHMWPLYMKGNLHFYSQSRFISALDRETVTFYTPTGPAPLDLLHASWLLYRMRLRWVTRDIPRSDARWIGGVLAQLSPGQIRDAFASAGYSAEEVEGFTRVLLDRIDLLRRIQY